ncbi:Hypothetical_protein [Hexamita inflata]|uniref:Hypothetical_protein n=1 Tax=Hexamita inflata TaxID=28002 RepID=A0AA86UYR7_9EUKA|nr:Hypothetical protein HINF_LOCUS61079 [Hexamita inflata]
MSLSQQSNQIFIYTQSTKDSQIKADVNNINVQTFTVFGFIKNASTIISSIINISIQFEVVKAALVCIQCDVVINNSTMIFVGQGQQLSGLVIESKEYIQIKFTSIQYKFMSIQSSGIVSVVNQQITEFSIAESRVSGYNFYIEQYSGYIAAQVNAYLHLNFTNLKVCVLDTPQIGTINPNIQIDQVQFEDLTCDNICDNILLAYGLCVDKFYYSQLYKETYECLHPFVYNTDKCICAQGYLLNESRCVNIVNELSELHTDSFQYKIKLIEIENLTDTHVNDT